MTEPADKAEVRRRRQEERLTFWKQARRHTEHITVEAGGVTLVVSTADAGVGRSLFVKGVRAERARLKAAAEIVDAASGLRGGMLVDVGANIGTTTLFALADGPWQRTLACEPAVDNYTLLRANVVLNRREAQVQTLPVAVADAPGTGTLLLHPKNAGAHRLSTTENVEPVVDPASSQAQPAETEVRITTLDELVENEILDPREVGLVWVDAQGSEAAVVAGGNRLCSEGIPFVLEVWPEALGYQGRAMLFEALVNSYTHFVDLHDAVRRQASPQPIQALPRLYAEYEGDLRFTDLVVYRAGERR